MQQLSLSQLIPAFKNAISKLEEDPAEAERIVTEWIIPRIPNIFEDIHNISYNTRCIRLVDILRSWYKCLIILYEGTDKLRRFGYRVPAVVEPEGSYTFEIDLTTGDRSCVCFAGETETVVSYNGDIIRGSFEELHEKFEDKTVRVPCNGTWKEGKVTRIPYAGELYKIKLANGVEALCTPDHLHLVRITQPCVQKWVEKNIKDDPKYERLYRSIMQNPRIIQTKDFGKRVWLPFATQGFEAKESGDYNLGRFIGLYIAEGHCYDYHLRFTLSPNETHLADFIISFAKNMGANASTYIRGKPRVNLRRDVNVHGKKMVQLIKTFVDGNTCYAKRLKDTVFSMSKEFRRGLIEGVVEGDGWISRYGTRYLELANIDLVEDIAELAASLGYKYTLHTIRHKKGRRPSRGMTIILPETKTIHSYESDGYRWFKVKEIEKVEYRGDVFCFTNVGLFQLANGLITHNCPTQVYSASLGGSWVTYSCLINEKLKEVKARWRDKWAPPGAPCPTEVTYVANGDEYVHFPKRKVKDSWSNEHPTETTRVVKYADYLDMNYEYASRLITHVYEPMVDELEKMIMPKL